jgi:putative protein-disulfide isomerase
MCSWCWGYRPAWHDLKSALPDGIEVVNVLGGLAPDSNEPMPEEMQKSIEGHWHKIQDMLGTRFNFNFWTECKPRRDTYKACRAVLVAAQYELEERMILAIQRAYYLEAKNPSDIDVLVDLAIELGIDGRAFRSALESEDTEKLFSRERSLAQNLGVRGFPSIRLVKENKVYPITVDYQDHQVSLGEIVRLV